MSEKDHIRTLLKEAKIYRTQGLLEESREKYLEILARMETLKKGPKNEAFIRSIQKKLHDVRNEIDEIDNPPETPELSAEVQQLISNLFAFSEDKVIAAVEGAVALAEFGQYEGALEEFQKLLDKRISPMIVAQNMIRCHLQFASPKAALDQFKKWMSAGTFSSKELGYLRTFYVKMLRSRKKSLEPIEDGHIEEPEEDLFDTPEIQPSEIAEDSEDEEDYEDILEILSISIEVMQSPGRDRIVEFEVTYQLGNKISFIVDADDRELTETFETGTYLAQVHCFSPVSTFEASGVISEKKKITTGPRKGDYAFRMTLNTP
jgi:tetratricopeptide (TPR) repeat protein